MHLKETLVNANCTRSKIKDAAVHFDYEVFRLVQNTFNVIEEFTIITDFIAKAIFHKYLS